MARSSNYDGSRPIVTAARGSCVLTCSYFFAFASIITLLLVAGPPRRLPHRRRLSQPWLTGGHSKPAAPKARRAPRVPAKPRGVDDDSAPAQRDIDDSPDWTWSRCSRFFDDRFASARVQLFPTVRFNYKSYTDDVAAYTMQPHWPRPCVMRYFEMLQSCSRHHPGNRIQDCVNVAPAGSGTVTLTEALKGARLPFCCEGCEGRDYDNRSNGDSFAYDVVRAHQQRAHHTDSPGAPRGCYHHSHFMHLGAIQKLGAKCAIMTLRNPVQRIESSFRWEFLGGLAGQHHQELNKYNYHKQYHQSDVNKWVTKQLDNGHIPSHISFSFSHLKYLGGLSAEMCAAQQFELHILCSEDLDHELVRLRDVFPGADVRPGHAHATARSDAAAGSWKLDAARLSPEVAARVNRLYREDRLIHDLLCSNYSRQRRHRW